MGSHLWQLRDLNQPLEVLQVAGAVEELLQPARGRELLGTALAQPRLPTPNVGSSNPSPGSRKVSPGHHTVLEGTVVCAATKPTAGPGRTPSPASHLWQKLTAGGFLP